jgi:hypothetical protein
LRSAAPRGLALVVGWALAVGPALRDRLGVRGRLGPASALAIREFHPTSLERRILCQMLCHSRRDPAGRDGIGRDLSGRKCV